IAMVHLVMAMPPVTDITSQTLKAGTACRHVRWPNRTPGRYHPRHGCIPRPRAMSRTLQSEPRRDGYRMPGEFEPHAGCWMLWPERPDNWRRDAEPARAAFTAVATAIRACVPVTGGRFRS